MESTKKAELFRRKSLKDVSSFSLVWFERKKNSICALISSAGQNRFEEERMTCDTSPRIRTLNTLNFMSIDRRLKYLEKHTDQQIGWHTLGNARIAHAPSLIQSAVNAPVRNHTFAMCSRPQSLIILIENDEGKSRIFKQKLIVQRDSYCRELGHTCDGRKA